MTGGAAWRAGWLGWLTVLLILVTACGRSPEQGADRPSATSAAGAAPAGLCVQEYPVPAGSRPHDVAPAADGRSVWYTAQGSGHLGLLDPATGDSRLIPLGDELEGLVAAVAPWLLELSGVGSISAAQILVSWSHAGRLRSEAAFAAVAGVNPIPASSGQVVRHRLNRSGDRQLNRALHTIVVARLRDDPTTRTYAARRRGEGKSVREIRRCLIGGVSDRPGSRQRFGTWDTGRHP